MCSQWHLFLSASAIIILIAVCIEQGNIKKGWWVEILNIIKITKTPSIVLKKNLVKDALKMLKYCEYLYTFFSSSTETNKNSNSPTLDFEFLHVFVLFLWRYAKKKAVQILWSPLQRKCLNTHCIKITRYCFKNRMYSDDVRHFKIPYCMQLNTAFLQSGIKETLIYYSKMMDFYAWMRLILFTLYTEHLSVNCIFRRNIQRKQRTI